MAELGKKYTCYSCHTKFYDLGKPTPVCPKCGADQRDAEETPVVTSGRGRRVVEEPIEEPEFTADGEATDTAAGDEDEEIVPEPDRDAEEDDDDDDEEEY